MAKRKTDPGTTKAAEPICRLVSLVPQSVSGSARILGEAKAAMHKFVVGFAIIMLIGFAAIGMVFTIKHRQTKPDGATTFETTVSPTPRSTALTSRTKAVASAPVVPTPQPRLTVVTPVEPMSLQVEPESLVSPREVITMVEKKQIATVPVAIAPRPKQEPTVEPTREPKAPISALPELPVEKPASKDLQETTPATGRR